MNVPQELQDTWPGAWELDGPYSFVLELPAGRVCAKRSGSGFWKVEFLLPEPGRPLDTDGGVFFEFASCGMDLCEVRKDLRKQVRKFRKKLKGFGL